MAAVALLAAVWMGPARGARSGGSPPARPAACELRLALWSDSLRLVRDHPLGVGAGDFEHAFVPYQARGRLEPQETVVFRSPHNEYLRFLAEDGAPVRGRGRAPLRAARGAEWRRAGAVPRRCARWSRAGGAFLAVEALFQFPLGLAFGALAAAITVGAALAAVEGGRSAGAAPRCRGSPAPSLPRP